MFLSDFRPREEYYVLLNDESSTIKRFGKKMLKCFFFESVWSRFSFFFSFSIFSRFFFFFFLYIYLKRRPLGIRKSSKYS